jgi:hypothetical protein
MVNLNKFSPNDIEDTGILVNKEGDLKVMQTGLKEVKIVRMEDEWSWIKLPVIEISGTIPLKIP